MAEWIYALCAIASVGCAVLLLRAFLRQRLSLLLWSSICFTCLALNNVLVFVDLILVPDIDLTWVRVGTASLGLMTLAFALVLES
jgi:hypothetical protein